MRNSTLLYIAISVLIGGLICLQGIINARLARAINEPLQAAFISFFVGTLALGVYIVVTGHSLPSLGIVKRVPTWFFIGGVFGAMFITTVIFVLPKIGTASLVAATVAGQMIMAVLFDHFGWWEIAVRPFGLVRLIGVLMLTGGVILLQKF